MIEIKRRYKRNGIIVVDRHGKSKIISGKQIEFYTLLVCLLVMAVILASFMFLGEKNNNNELSNTIAKKNTEIAVLQGELETWTAIYDAKTKVVISLESQFMEVKESYEKIISLGGWKHEY